LGEGTRFFDVELWAEQHGLAEEGWAEAAEAGMLQIPKPSRREKNQGCEGLPDKGRISTPNQTVMRPQCSICGCTSVGNTHTGNLPGQMTCGHPKSAKIRVPCDDNSYHAKHRVRNDHPTTKSVRLFQYLIELLSPSGGVILDPFCGSGSTGVAAIQCGRSFIGVEMEADYVTIANARCKWAEENVPEAEQQLSLEEQAE